MKAAKLAGPATLAAGGALLFVALFFGDGPSDGRLFWIGAFAVLAVVALGSSLPVPGGPGVVCLGLLAALAVWVGLSMAWSIAPDLSWASFDRILVYCAFAALGLLATRVPRPARTVAGGLALLARPRARLGAARQGDPVALPGRRARRAAPEPDRLLELARARGRDRGAARALARLARGTARARASAARCSSTWPSWSSC